MRTETQRISDRQNSSGCAFAFLALCIMPAGRGKWSRTSILPHQFGKAQNSLSLQQRSLFSREVPSLLNSGQGEMGGSLPKEQSIHILSQSAQLRTAALLITGKQAERSLVSEAEGHILIQNWVLSAYEENIYSSSLQQLKRCIENHKVHSL